MTINLVETREVENIPVVIVEAIQMTTLRKVDLKVGVGAEAQSKIEAEKKGTGNSVEAGVDSILEIMVRTQPMVATSADVNPTTKMASNSMRNKIPIVSKIHMKVKTHQGNTVDRAHSTEKNVPI